MVADENDATSWLDGRWVEVPQKVPECLSVEPPHFTPKEESAVAEANGSEVPHALPRGVMKHNWILVLWRNPHPAS